jgi:hypothetical protein
VIALADTDHDGMPDAWETAQGFNPNDATDRNGDKNSNGYTNVEEYLNELAGDQPTTTATSSPVIAPAPITTVKKRKR